MSRIGDNSQNMARIANVEPLKTSVASCMRAIAQDGELEITFGKDKPGITGQKVRLPDPGKNMTTEQVAITRGLSDSMALRRAMHDSGVHARHLPQGENAQAVFNAVEQARVEAIGSQAMTGMGDNIHQMLEEKYFRSDFANATSMDDAPLEDVVGLLLREKLCGWPVAARKTNRAGTAKICNKNC